MLFSMMKEKGIKPINSFTFTAVLTACRQSGLVHEGRKHFESMIKDYSLVPGPCRIYGNVELAELVAARLSQLDPRTTTPMFFM
ncbi:hypothetical protein RchiOBHm_Chr5g0054641 [Rosa chinensis]|uniref:Pentatricopeptide n=1 Tax=Rosa chinensis TaxID=74649 RepID=A0A2P6QG66_ROSCH|nr:hypothetical protein RchiOBHm_Chr5g0054641 [Rosa chinensis]